MRLSNKRYEEIKRLISEFLEDYDVHTLPIDINDLLKKMNIKIKKSSDYVLELNPTESFYFHDLPNGYCYYSKEKNRHIIFLDDIETGHNRQRFSLAHEIMHIILGHTKQDEETEAEADFGAAYLLAPHSLVLIDSKILNYDKFIFADIFGISPLITASRVKDMFLNRYNLSKTKPINDYETTINNLLGESYISHIKDLS